MAFCPRCGKFTDDNYMYCLSCGAPMPHPAVWQNKRPSGHDDLAWVLFWLLVIVPIAAMAFVAIIFIVFWTNFPWPWG